MIILGIIVLFYAVIGGLAGFFVQKVIRGGALPKKEGDEEDELDVYDVTPEDIDRFEKETGIQLKVPANLH